MLYLTFRINSEEQLNEIGQIQFKKELSLQLESERKDLKNEFEEIRAKNQEMLDAQREEVEMLSKRKDAISKETKRLEEVVIVLQGDIDLLLSPAKDVHDVKEMLEELAASLAGMASNYDYNEQLAGTVKKFLKKIVEIQQRERPTAIGVPKRAKKKPRKTHDEILQE